jgi:hypothetical protein
VPSPTPRYPQEFKQEAVKLYRFASRSFRRSPANLESPRSPSGGGSNKPKSTLENAKG